MSEKNKKRQVTKITVFVTSMFVILLSVTYALMSTIVSGEKQVVINAGVLDLVLEEENEITISDALPMYDEVGMIQEDVFVFRLVNKTSNSTNYVLKLEEIETGTLDKSDVKYGLVKEGKSTIDFVSNISGEVIDSGTIAGSDTLDYGLRFWIDSSVTDISKIEGKFLKLKLSVEVSQDIQIMTLLEKLQLEEKVDTTTTIDFTKISSETNGRGIYKYTEDGKDIYYWRGAVTTNHIKFADFCWEIVRTTKDGGVKIIYDGVPAEDGSCANTGEASQLTALSAFNSSAGSPTYNGYMYGTVVSISERFSTTLTEVGYLYGNDVTYQNGTYTLKNTITATGNWSSDSSEVYNAHHYTCFNTTGSCSTVYFIIPTASSNADYINLTGGKTIETRLIDMYTNTKNSTIKNVIDNWYKTNIDEKGYTNKLEDAVYCNDRSGWSKDSIDSSASFNYSAVARLKNGTPNLNCDKNDAFTVNETETSNGSLTNPVGLLTADEIMLAGGQNSSNSDFYLYTGTSYLTLSPRHFGITSAGDYGFYFDPYVNIYYVNSSGFLSHYNASNQVGVRPVISLKPETLVYGGDGSSLKPYIVE